MREPRLGDELAAIEAALAGLKPVQPHRSLLPAAILGRTGSRW